MTPKIRYFLITIIVLSFGSYAQDPDEKDSDKLNNARKVARDLNYDGRVDRVEYYDAKGMLAKTETDTNNNNKLDEWVFYDNGIIARAQKDSNGDGKADRLHSYSPNGVLKKTELDTDNDGEIDEWVYYSNGKPRRVDKDTTGDGIPDASVAFDEKGDRIENGEAGDGVEGDGDEWRWRKLEKDRTLFYYGGELY